MKTAADTVKKVALVLAAKSANIPLDDAEPRAVKQGVLTLMLNSGQELQRSRACWCRRIGWRRSRPWLSRRACQTGGGERWTRYTTMGLAANGSVRPCSS